MSMQNIQASDLVIDEYGNYYEVVGTEENGEGTLTGIQVSSLLFEKSFQLKAGDAEPDKPVGSHLQELVLKHIEEVQEKGRPVYALRDLIVNQIDVFAVDITKPHPKSNG